MLSRRQKPGQMVSPYQGPLGMLRAEISCVLWVAPQAVLSAADQGLWVRKGLSISEVTNRWRSGSQVCYSGFQKAPKLL